MENRRKDYVIPIIIIGFFFFIFGFVTWLNGVLIPYLKIACELNNFESYFVAFSFYISYFVMALPSSWVLKKTGFKKGMSVGLIVMALGTALFIPAAYARMYELFLAGLFVMGTGLAILQTASNPYITILGPIESAAKRISIMGIANKGAGVISPLILGAIVLKDTDKIVEKIKSLGPIEKALELDELALRVVVPYLVMTVILLGLAALIKYTSLPEINEEEDESVKAKGDRANIFKYPYLIFGVIALFLYVGVEVLAGDTIISYGVSQGIPMDNAKVFTSYTLAAMLLGYVLGILLIPKVIKQEQALLGSAILGVVFSIAAIYGEEVYSVIHQAALWLDNVSLWPAILPLPTFGGSYTSVFFIAALGLANAIMWPAIWPLSIDGIGKFIKTGSALLIMGIAGGAVLPLLYGYLSDIESIGTTQAYWIMVPSYLFILFFAVSGRKIGKAAKTVK